MHKPFTAVFQLIVGCIQFAIIIIEVELIEVQPVQKDGKQTVARKEVHKAIASKWACEDLKRTTKSNCAGLILNTFSSTFFSLILPTYINIYMQKYTEKVILSLIWICSAALLVQISLENVNAKT